MEPRSEGRIFWLASGRPRLHHLGLFIAAYVLGCGFAQLLAIAPGTGISIWPPGGLFLATLILAPRRSWLWWAVAGCLAELFSNALWFHSPLPAAFLIYVGNALEAVTGAWLLHRTLKRTVRLDTLPEVLAFVVLGAGVAPIVAATVGSATLKWFGIQSQTFVAAWPLWWIGDATGILIVTPLALSVFQNWRGGARLSAARWVEAGVLGLIFLGVAALSVGGPLPFAYIIMPPLLWAALRFEIRGAVVALSILALITAAFTISGSGHFAGDPASQREKLIMLQLFLATSALSAVMAAAISREHQLGMLALRQSTEALREREAKIRRLVDSDIIGIVIWDLDGALIDANDAFLRMVKYERADLQAGLGWFDMTPPEWQEVHAREEAEELAATGMMQAREKEYFRKDGSRVPVLIGAACFEGQSRQGVAYILDLTERKRAEAALRDRERELSQLVDIVPSHLWRLTPDGAPTFFNKRMVDYLGLGVADVGEPGMSPLAAMISAVVHPEDAAEMEARLGRCLASGERFSMQYRLRRSDGAYRWMSSRAEPMRNSEARIVQWYGLCHDIDDQVQAEEALRARERELSLLVDMVPSNLWRLSPEGVTTLANRHMAAFLGRDLEDKRELDVVFDTIFHPDDVEEVSAVLNRCLATGDRFSMKYRLLRHDGVYRWMSGRAEPMRDDAGQIVQWFGLCHDIDDQVHAEEALRRASDRLARATQAASLAELSASIAHEVNQPLAAIVANSHACQRWLSADPPNLERARMTAEHITRDANSAADVVSRVRALFRQTAQARSAEDLNGLIGEVCRLMGPEIAAKGGRIETDLTPNLPEVMLDRVQVQQVLVNLMRNGIEAMEATAEDRRALLIRSRHDEHASIRIEVCDTGRGFGDAERIFEPFFTTKQNGMGMGLAICRSIVESHGGRLWTANREAGGAIVAFTFPETAIETRTARGEPVQRGSSRYAGDYTDAAVHR